MNIWHLASKATMEQISELELEDFEEEGKSENKLESNEKDLFFNKSFYLAKAIFNQNTLKRFMLQREQYWHSSDFSRIPYCPPKNMI